MYNIPPNQTKDKQRKVICVNHQVRFSVGTLWQLKYGSSLDSSHVVVSGKWSLMSWNLFIAIIFFFKLPFFQQKSFKCFLPLFQQYILKLLLALYFEEIKRRPMWISILSLQIFCFVLIECLGIILLLSLSSCFEDFKI